jgi:hypothetical protein
MENRSFDHMLGHLRLEGGRADVDALASGMANLHAARLRPLRPLVLLRSRLDLAEPAYAVTGKAAGSKDNKNPPIYDLPSFARQLDAKRVSWLAVVTSIIKTILLRFCRKQDGSTSSMGARVANARLLGELQTLDAPRPAPARASFRHLLDRAALRRSRVFETRLEAPLTGDVPDPAELNELQEGIVAAQRRLRAAGLPEGQP